MANGGMFWIPGDVSKELSTLKKKTGIKSNSEVLRMLLKIKKKKGMELENWY